MFEAGADTTVARAVIYSLCHATMSRCFTSFDVAGDAADDDADNDTGALSLLSSSVLHWLFRLLSIDLPADDPTKNEQKDLRNGLERLQRGCIDGVACLCRASHVLLQRKRKSLAATPLVVEVDGSGSTSWGTECLGGGDNSDNSDKDDDDITQTVLRVLCGENKINEATFTSKTLRICCANVLITSIKMWPPNTGAVLGRTTKGVMLSDILNFLIKSCLVQLTMDPIVRSAALQVIFIGLHAYDDHDDPGGGSSNSSSGSNSSSSTSGLAALRGLTTSATTSQTTTKESDFSSFVSLIPLHELAMGACQDSSSDLVRMAGLKLLGMMIGKIPDIFSKTLPGAAGHTKSVVSSLANMDPSKDVRHMAENIYKAVFAT